MTSMTSMTSPMLKEVLERQRQHARPPSSYLDFYGQLLGVGFPNPNPQRVKLLAGSRYEQNEGPWLRFKDWLRRRFPSRRPADVECPKPASFTID